MGKEIVVFESEQDSQEDGRDYTQARGRVKRVIEALLFASNEPISLQKIREITESIYPFKPKVLADLLWELQIEYHSQERACQIEEIAQGFILRSRKEYAPFIEQLFRSKRGDKLSQAGTEVLAIIAYRQPITRTQIEAIRGVDSSGIIQTLLERELIESVGKLEGPGKPTLYGVTKYFLTYFGLKDLNNLTQVFAKDSR